MSLESCSVQCEPGLEPVASASVKQEAGWAPVKQEPSEAAAAGLYAGHEVMAELALGPTTVQPPDAISTTPGTHSRTATNTKTSAKRKGPSTFRSKPQTIVVPPASSSITVDQCLSPPPKRTISGSGLSTSKADDSFDSWRTENEDVDSDVEEDTVPLNDYAAEAARDSMQPAAERWLATEDADADKTLRGLLPTDHLTFDWSCDPNIFSCKREEFDVTPGPTFTLTEDMTALQVFFKFFDEDLLDLIVAHTNEHARRMMDNQTSTHARVNFWKDTDRGEIVVFFAVLILQGCAPFTVEVDYWRENGYLTLKYFKDIMTYNRFVLLKKFMHFTDNASPMTELTSDEKKLRKVSPLLDHLNRKFSELYLPGRNIVVDESLLNWHGRLSFGQKIARKAAKVGIKSQELCESSTGYLWKFFVYTGTGNHDEQTDSIDETNRNMKGQQTDITDEQTRLTDEQRTDNRLTNTDRLSTNTTALILQNLVKPLLNKGYTIIVDNLYNAPLLARYLKGQQTDCFGPLRVNRVFVPESFTQILTSEINSGEVVQCFCRDMSVTTWRDTNIVSMLSTYHEGGKENYVSHKHKPEVALAYNTVMDGVDKKDQLLSNFKMDRRNLAWHKKVFRRLLNATVLNAHIIFKTQHSAISHRAFRLALADEMIKQCSPPKIQPLRVQSKSLLAVRGAQREQRPMLIGNHFIGQSHTKYARCIWCRQSRTKYSCKQCKVSLCLEICFEEFHTAE